MTQTANIGNVYTIPKVILSPISDEQAGTLDNNLEPPFVRVRARNASSCFLDNFDMSSRLSNTSFIVGNKNILFKRTKRFSLSYFVGFVPTPNINPRNNTVGFTTGAGSFSVTIPVGFYTRTQAIAALLTALNTLSGTSGVTFTMPSQYPGSDIYATLTGTGAFRIDSGTFTTIGCAFWGFLFGDARLSTAAPLATTLSLGPIQALYTRYYDVCSSSLLVNTKAANTSNREQGALLFRIYATSNPLGDPSVQWFQEFDNGPENTSWNFDAANSLVKIDFQLYDEFKQPYYLPNNETNASNMQLAIVCEL